MALITAQASDHATLWAETSTTATGGNIFLWGTGLISFNGASVVTSADDGSTWTTIYTAPATIMGLHVHNGAAYMAYAGHMMRSTNGTAWVESIALEATQYGVSWSWDGNGNEVIFGAYAYPKLARARAWLSEDNGLTWSLVFDVTGASTDYHIHKVSIDPHDGWLYVNLGDKEDLRGLYVSKDKGATWAHMPVDGPMYDATARIPQNGFLQCTYPDEGHVLWYTDNEAEVWLLDKERMELTMACDMADAMTALTLTSIELFDCVQGNDLLYALMRGVEEEKNYLWASADGIVWYLVQEVAYLAQPNLSFVGSTLYYNGGSSWADVSQEEFLASIGAVWAVETVTIPRGITVTLPVYRYYDITLTEADDTNYVLNPSMEDVTDGAIDSWGNPAESLLDAPEVSTDARVGSGSLLIDQDWTEVEGYTDEYRRITQAPNAVLPAGDYAMRFSVKCDKQLLGTYATMPLMEIWIDGAKQQFRHNCAVAGQWHDFIYYFSTVGGTLTDINWYVYDSTATYQLDRVSIAAHPYYSLTDSYDPEGESVLINDVGTSADNAWCEAGDELTLAKSYGALGVKIMGSTLTWVATKAGNASVGANWSGGVAPATGDSVLFDGTSTVNCTFDIDASAATFVSFALATGYTGVVTQSADIGVGPGGIHIAAGTLIGSGTGGKWMILSGPLTKTGGTITDNKLNLKTTDDITITSDSTLVLYNLWAQDGTLTVNPNLTVYNNLKVDEGAVISVATGKILTHCYYEGRTYTNSGEMTGAGTLYIRLYNSNMSIDFGVINCKTRIYLLSAGTSSYTLTTTSNTVLGSTLAIESEHASNTVTLDMAGKTLSATAITVSTRGILTNSGAAAACTVSGAFTVSGASSVVSGAIVLTYGTYVQSNGTATQVGNWSGGNVTASGGTLTGAGSASVTLTSSGDVNLTGATVTADKLNLVMTGLGKSFTAPNALLYALNISGTVSATSNDWWGITDVGSLTISGALILPGTSNVLYAYCPTKIVIPGGLAGTGALAITYNNSSSGVLSRIYSTGISAEVRIRSNDEKTATLGSDLLTNGKLLIENSGGATMTLDLNGFDLTCSTQVLGTGGNILWGEGVHHLAGNLDTSAGAVNFETSQLIFTKAATLKTAAEQPLYDMLIAPDVTLTLGSDVTVSHTYGNGGVLVPGAFALTASGSSYDKVFLPTELRANISPLIYPTGKRFMRRLERVQ